MTEERLFGQTRVLAEDEVQRICDAAFHLLFSTGVEFEDPEARRILAARGARVEGSRVRFPDALIREALEGRARRVVLGARDAKRSIELGRRRFVTTNGFGTTEVLESGNGKNRKATASDLVRLTRLADGLREVGYCQHQTTPQDVPQALLDVALAFIVLANTSKHVQLSTYSGRYVDAVIELGTIASDGARDGEDKTFSLGCCSVSPLRYPAEATVVLRQAAAHSIPFLIVCGAVAGVMSPVTLAGSLVVQTAEHLAGFVLSQAVRQGAPVALGSFTSPMDPRDGRQRLGAAELGLVNGATAQICRRLGLPFGYGTGGVTDSAVPGLQAGMEKAITTLSAAMAGVEVIHDGVSGILGAGMIVSYGQMVIDAEICRVVRRYLRGIEVTPETLAAEVIAQVGPGKSYLATKHTAAHFREEILLSDLWDRGGGERTLLESAEAKVEETLRMHRVSRLREEQIDAMVAVCGREGMDEKRARGWVPSD